MAAITRHRPRAATKHNASNARGGYARPRCARARVVTPVAGDRPGAREWIAAWRNKAAPTTTSASASSSSAGKEDSDGGGENAAVGRKKMEKDAASWIADWRKRNDYDNAGNGASPVAATGNGAAAAAATPAVAVEKVKAEPEAAPVKKEKEKKSLKIVFGAEGRKIEDTEDTENEADDEAQVEAPVMALATTAATSTAVATMGTAAEEEKAEPGAAEEYLRSLPGISAPFGYFDPLGLSSKTCKSVSEAKFWREAELMHARTAMMAVVGVIFAEKLPVLNNFFDEDVVGPAVTHWGQAPRAWLVSLGLIVSIFEIVRADRGFVEPGRSDAPGEQYSDGVQLLQMREDHVAGNADFDPWGLRKIFASDKKKRLEWSFDFRPGYRYPVTKRVSTSIEDNFRLMQTRELNNGRLAMIAIIAIFTQEVLYNEGFDYDYIHVKPCLTPASCSKLAEPNKPVPKPKTKLFAPVAAVETNVASTMPPDVVLEAPM